MEIRYENTLSYDANDKYYVYAKIVLLAIVKILFIQYLLLVDIAP